jgi:hypothetical protein
MHELIEWCTFAGAWLLVGGPVYQAVLELDSEEFEFDRIRELRTKIPAPPPISPWWWLLPPIGYLLERRRRDHYQHLLIAQMADDDYQALRSYMNKATGWLYVAGGGFLLAIGETYAIVEHEDWPIGIFWLLIAVMTALAIGHAWYRQRRTDVEVQRHQHSPTAE